MDLGKLNTTHASNRGAKLHLRHPGTGKFLYQSGEDGVDDHNRPVTITLLGADSQEYRKTVHALTTRRLNSSPVSARRGPKLDAEEMDADNLELLVASTVGWNEIRVDGSDLAFSKEEARRLYSNHPWIREQAEAFIADRANFLGN